MATKDTHNTVSARITAQVSTVTVLTADAADPAKAPAPKAHKGVTVFPEETIPGHPRRNLDTDRLVVALTYQSTVDGEGSLDAAMDLEQEILSALLDTTWAPADIEGIQHERTARGYHPKSPGWFLIKMYFTVYRTITSYP